ncbi:MAG: hypothetical protein KDA96_07380 [Planctomycetaceae bacterium]|nr:hypothetical protein [Planctomycetaceae bacterium]
MELPSCPSCGQSVLDDDAVDCPFCGASMSGGRKGKPAGGPKPSPQGKSTAATGNSAGKASASKPASAKSAESKPVQGIQPGKPVADDEDPFDLGGAGAHGRVIQALSKPERGKLHKVTCPMCDKPGFVSKSAIGKQVRCANPNCMIPVFTVPDPDAPETETRVPSRADISADADDAVAKAASGGNEKKNSMVVYGIAGAILLVLTLVGTHFLNNFGATDESELSRPVQPVSYEPLPDADNSETELTDTDTASANGDLQETPVEKVNPLDEAKRIAALLSAQAVNEQKDKGLIRRATAAAFFQTGQTALADNELKQLSTLERGTGGAGRLYRQIGPLLTEYWTRKNSGDAAAATRLNAAFPLAETIRNIGRLETEDLLGLASVLVVESRIEDAERLVAMCQRDRTNDAERDAMSGAAWFHLASRLRTFGLAPMSAMETFNWDDALWIAVGTELALRQEWDAFDRWIARSPSTADRSNLLAAAVELGSRRQLPADVCQKLETLADATDAATSLRIRALTAAALRDSERLNNCETRLNALAPGTAAVVPEMKDLLDYNIRNTQSAQQNAEAAAAVAAAAVVNNNEAIVQAALNQMMAQIRSLAPPVTLTRPLIHDVEEESRRVKARIKTEYGLSNDTQIDQRFRAYRTGVNRLSTAAEQRRVLLVTLLSRIVRAGGAAAVNQLLETENGAVLAEVAVDDLSGIIAAEAIRSGKDVASLKSIPPGLRIIGSTRLAPPRNVVIGSILPMAWASQRDQRLDTAMLNLAIGDPRSPLPTTLLPRQREALINELIETAAQNTSLTADQILDQVARVFGTTFPAAAKTFRDILQEESYQTVSRMLARRGDHAAAEKWLSAQKGKIDESDRLRAIYGLVLGLTDQTGN